MAVAGGRNIDTGEEKAIAVSEQGYVITDDTVQIARDAEGF